MDTTFHLQRMPADVYLAFERASERKHELRDGRIVLRKSANQSHNQITTNAIGLVGDACKGRPAEFYGCDMRIKVPGADFYAYPDLSAVACSPTFEDSEEDSLLNPNLLVEVYSPDTEGDDRGTKFEHYLQMPSLMDYLLISQDRVHVEHYSRLTVDSWRLRECKTLEQSVQIESLDCALPLAELYDKVLFGRHDRRRNILTLTEELPVTE